MALAAPRPDLLPDTTASSLRGPAPPLILSSTSREQLSVLGDLAVDHVQNTSAPPAEPAAKSLTADFATFHGQSPKKPDLESILKNKLHRRPIAPDTFEAPQQHKTAAPAAEQKHAHFELPQAPSAEPKSKALEEEERPKSQSHTTRVCDPFAKEQLAKHRAATPIEGGEGLLTDQPATEEEAIAMADAMGDVTLAVPDNRQKPDQSQVSPKVLLNAAGHLTPRPAATPSLRIEDSFEELDKLEDQFEAVDNIVQVERVPSPDKAAGGGSADQAALAGTSSATKKLAARSGSVRGRTAELSRTGSVRKADEKSPAKPSPPKRAPVPRPASLLPPKPPARSSKVPTMPTFELPGEAVARRLKEQKEARMSMAPAELARPASPPRIRSSKVPTRPTFELPGEAISRRKREERDAKLRAQEEEERKRREFKARPVRASIAPNSYPRGTIASRARQSKAAASENAEVAAGAAVTSPSKRYSALPPASTPRPALSVASNSQPRGRGSTVDSPSTAHASRTASSSTGSLSGKRSTVSAEDVVQQKMRARQIYSRDNSIAIDRDRERHDREAVTKTARQEAAERSRTLGRSWAEKQKQRLKRLAPGAGANVTVR